MGMYGLAIFAAIQWIYSFLLAPQIRVIGVKATYLLSQLLASACYILFLFYHRLEGKINV